jgi:hypothetical protein
MYLTGSYRRFCPKTPEYTFFPEVHGTSTKEIIFVIHKASITK